MYANPYQPYQYPVAQPMMQNPYQARLTQMEQTYPQFAQQTTQQMQTGQVAQQGPIARAVTSKEEALGVPVDFSGALMVFTDVSHGKVYTKSFNMSTGAADFREYAVVAQPSSATPVEAVDVAQQGNDYVTHKELNELIAQILGGNRNAIQPDNDGNKHVNAKKSSSGTGVSASSTDA